MSAETPWYEGLDFELNIDDLTLRDLIEAAEQGYLASLFRMFGLGPTVTSAEQLRLAGWVVLKGARQHRPETTLDEILDAPYRIALGALETTAVDDVSPAELN